MQFNCVGIHKAHIAQIHYEMDTAGMCFIDEKNVFSRRLMTVPVTCMLLLCLFWNVFFMCIQLFCIGIVPNISDSHTCKEKNLFLSITQFLKINPTIIQKKAHVLLFYPETIWRWEKYPCYFVLLRTPYVFHSWIQLLDIEPVSNLRNHLCLAST